MLPLGSEWITRCLHRACQRCRAWTSARFVQLIGGWPARIRLTLAASPRAMSLYDRVCYPSGMRCGNDIILKERIVRVGRFIPEHIESGTSDLFLG